MLARKTTGCRICGRSNLSIVLDLGEQALSGYFPKPDDAEIPKLPLVLTKCMDCHLVQLLHSVAGNILYHENYGYRSGINATMRNHLAGIAAAAETIVKLQAGDVVLDIASNDGTLLHSYTAKNIRLVGIDPAIRQFGHFYRDDVLKIPEFFAASAFTAALPGLKARIITSVAVFYDLESPGAFVGDLRDILADDGIWILEQSDLRSMLAANSFDTVCHEHLEYYSIAVLKALAEAHGLRVFDVEFNASNGGSSRLYVCHKNGPYREKGNRIAAALELERAAGLENTETFLSFAKSLGARRTQCLDFIRREKARGKVFHAYGASTKGNVLLQWYGLGPAQIDAVADRNPQKWGCVTPATRIPII